MNNLDIAQAFMKLRCTEKSIRYLVHVFSEPITDVAEHTGRTVDDLLSEAIAVLVEDGVSNEFAYHMLCMWRDGTKDNKNFTAREAMLYQHIYWTNVEQRDYMTNSLRVQLPKEG